MNIQFDGVILLVCIFLYFFVVYKAVQKIAIRKKSGLTASGNGFNLVISIALGFAIPLFVMGLLSSDFFGEKRVLDKQMFELCKKDGGVKIYETVKLPPEMFDKDGYPFPGWRNRLNKEDRLSKDYIYLHERKVLNDGDIFKGGGQLTRIDLKIIRKSDNKILAEHINYLRAGGDGFVIGHPTGNSCSFSTDSMMEKVNGALEKLVFTKN